MILFEIFWLFWEAFIENGWIILFDDLDDKFHFF